MWDYFTSTDNFKYTSVIVGGIFAALSIIVDTKDKKTNKITKIGAVVLFIAALSIGAAYVAQMAENVENEKRA